LIEEILIRDLGVISEAKLEFGPGLTVLTGETGAGKTMVLNALGLLLGERSDSSAVRKGQSAAYVEGRWLLANESLKRIQELEIDLDDPELILARSVSQEGRSKASMSGRSVPVGLLTEIGQQLVVVHGQADQIRLRSQAAQREALDQFAGKDFSQTLSSYKKSYQSWRKVELRLQELRSELESRQREANEIRQAVAELEELDPKPLEDQELFEKAERLTHLEELRVAATLAHEELSSESLQDQSDAITQVGKARRALEQVASHDATLVEQADLLKQIGSSIGEVAAGLSGYLASLDVDTHQLETIQNRRAALNQAMRRFGPTLDEVISFRESASSRLLELDSSGDEIERLTAEEASLRESTIKLAAELTSLRKQAAAKLSVEVTAELESLAMNGSALVVEVSKSDELRETGSDTVSIQLSAYPGAEPRPIGKGASGGELSRIMLAIEVVLAQSELAPTFIFDEVDAGVGGAAATEVGKRLAKLAKSAQVIVVTHLPQVAAFANRHLRVLKSTSHEFTASDVVRLEGEAVVEELTRMLSGLSESATGRSHAQELLELAKSNS
jgi:DNA repair protein RecN (Recombination protein N)